MDESELNTPLKLRPVLVFRSRTVRTHPRAAVQSQSVRKQFTNVKQYADEMGVATEPFILITRTSARYHPQYDPVLLQAIETARERLEMLLLDDVFRLIEFRDRETALRDINALRQLKAPAYSVLHGQFLPKMSAKFIRAQYGDRIREFRHRSDSVRAGIERARLPDTRPDPRASAAGVRMKKRIADARARKLIEEIDRIRAGMGPERRSNLSAIAAAMNGAGVPTPSGRGHWQGITVKRVLARTGRSLEPA